MNGADLAVLVVPFLDGSSNRVEAGTNLEAVNVVNFDIADTVKQKVGVALPASAAPPPKGELRSRESLEIWLLTVSAGDSAVKRQLPFGSSHSSSSGR